MKMKNGRKRFVTEYAGLFCMEPVIVLTTFGVSALYNIPTEYMIYLIALNIAVWLMVLCIQYRFFKKKNIVIHWGICCLNILHFISFDTFTEEQRKCRPIIFPEMG